MRNLRVMTIVAPVIAILFLTTSLFAQAQQADGIAAAWDVKNKMVAMAADVGRIEDLLRRVRPAEWIAKGAPDAYLRQLESSQTSMQLLIEATEKLAKDPERLSVALDALFRMDNMDLFLQSLQQGVRRYQGPSLADDIVRFMGDNARHRDMLRQHSVELAATREVELKTINTEAQRCRMELARKNEPETQAPPPPPVRRRKAK
ncbi:MAG TPA: hypothetical protein VEX68_07515 [Bryobacteraceae bacterium]|nr:hypothetical protein [Bryobacteraceae bacterium]